MSCYNTVAVAVTSKYLNDQTRSSVNDTKIQSVSAEYFSLKEGAVVVGFPLFECVEVGKFLLDGSGHGRVELRDSFKVTARLLRIPRTDVCLASSVQSLHIVCSAHIN